MMSNIPAKEVPDDLKILWEQQQKIASTASGRGYRWHPRYYKNKTPQRPG
ncbi:unnamed protein product [Porites lobata]|uniref:Uncharacterized protein n=1 Tax=Porites lobata TaxID=104759 RepID=A0ABN8QX38_9CNID|nr:unnamed protein product [Porites lobata]